MLCDQSLTVTPASPQVATDSHCGADGVVGSVGSQLAGSVYGCGLSAE